MIPLYENIFRAGTRSILKKRYVKSDESKKILFIFAKNLNWWAMIQNPPYDGFTFDENVKLEDILKNSEVSHFVYIRKLNLKNLDEIREYESISLLSWE